MTAPLQVTDDLLDFAYTELDFANGVLKNATGTPDPSDPGDWCDQGEWLSLAESIGVEKVLFVDNNPVVVFARTITSDAVQLRQLYNRIWCMARPQLLFLACPGELMVLDLTRPPVKPEEDLADQDRQLDVARSIADVQAKLSAYSRARIETGRLFEDHRFEPTGNRADEALIRDLKTVRRRLLDTGLSPKHAHALIGRSIFVRYLEDRQILTPDYFAAVASTRPEWQAILSAPFLQLDFDPDMERLLYPRVFADHEFTYALFDRLSEDFNGDLFPADPDEKQQVMQAHLTLLQEFLQGRIDAQQGLFFFAYRFDVIPIELISSIYEEFYNTQVGENGNQGSHYTPPALVEFILAQLLTPERMQNLPRILDPACGSGIFLVEAFRRLVRYQVVQQNGQVPNRAQLLHILREQICGIEINPEAIRVAAFSLYLAFLHYQNPPDIRANTRLPNLKYEPNAEKDARHQFDILVAANSFTLGVSLLDPDIRTRFTGPCADIVVGNPPWGYPGPKDEKGRRQAQDVLRWCQERSLPVGDQELSQAFIYRTLEFLRDNGCAGLLVPTGVFFKAHANSRAFREKWLSTASLLQVVNFAHARDVFFSGSKRGANAIAPFASVIFQKGRPPHSDHLIEYWSAKKTPLLNKLEAVVLSNTDRKLLSQTSVLHNDVLWKVYWWGNHRDEVLLQKLNLNIPLADYPDLITHSGRGYQAGNEESADWLRNYRELPTDELHRYGTLNFSRCRKVAELVARKREPELYEGLRLLFKKGPSQAKGHNGQLIARLETEPFCFLHSIYAFRFSSQVTWQAKAVLGIFWSSLTRYYFFLTASSWGTWHHTINLEEVRQFPVRLEHRDPRVVKRLVEKVEALQKKPEDLGGLFSSADQQADQEERAVLERELDEAVFDLYELTEPERDQIRDICKDGLDLFYRHVNSNAIKPVERLLDTCEVGTRKILPGIHSRRVGLEPYLYAFLNSWDTYVEPEGEFSWQLILPNKNTSILAVVFTAQEKNAPLSVASPLLMQTWDEVLKQLDTTLTTNYRATRIYTDGVIRAIVGPHIIIIKRNERYLWTPSMARDDAEATMLHAIQAQEAQQWP